MHETELKYVKPNSVSTVIFFNWMNTYSAKGHYIQGARPSAINHILFLIAHYIIHIDLTQLPVLKTEHFAIVFHHHDSQGFLISSGFLYWFKEDDGILGCSR